MYYCNTSSWCVHVGPHVGGSSVKTMQEMIPVAYKTLRQEIERLQEDVWSKQVPPVMNRDAFWYIWKYGYVHTHNMQHNTYHFKPSARMHSEGYGTWFVSGVCLSVCLSVCLLPRFFCDYAQHYINMIPTGLSLHWLYFF